MKQDSERWIEDVLESADGIQAIEIPTTLVDSLKKIPSTYNVQKQHISLTFVWMAAAGLLLLLTLNIKTLTEQHASAQNSASFYSTYYSYLDQLQ